MKKFKNTSISGWSGEYYFAYWIVSNFKWPCRLLDIDVGIDAQVEVFENEFSTGDFFAVQIKSTISESPNISLYTSDFIYWKQIDGVVILVSIVLGDGTSSPIIYYKIMDRKRIKKLTLASQKNKGGSTVVRFNKSDILTKKSKKKWLNSLIRGKSISIVKKAKKIDDLINKVISYSDDTDTEKQDIVGHKDTFSDLNDIWCYHEKIHEATKFHKNLKNYSKDVRKALNEFRQNEDNLLDIFSKLVEEVRTDYQPEELLPDNLHDELKEAEYSWVTKNKITL